MVVCGQRFWWIWENENYEDKMMIENDFSFTWFPLAFLRFDKVWMILNGSLTSEFCGSEFVLINILKSFVELKIKDLIFGASCHWFYRMHSHVGEKKKVSKR
jgi:hypothetical protein